MSDLLSFVISYGWLFLLFGLGSIGNRSLGGVGVFCLIIGLLWVLTLIWFIISIATLPKENSPPSPPKPPQPPKPPAPSRQNITSTDTTVLKVDPPGDIYKAAGIIAGSYVDYEIDYDIYQKQLDDFLKHGVIPGVEVTTESCKKTWGMIYELFVGREFEKAGYDVVYSGIQAGVKDCGIDLIVKKSRNEITIVQCKYWRDTLIDSDVVSRMSGARELYFYKHRQFLGDDIDLDCMIITSSRLTEEARDFARNQAIDFVEEKAMDQYSIPWVKGWIINRTFYLPWDRNYIYGQGHDNHFFTIKEAVDYGCWRRGEESDLTLFYLPDSSADIQEQENDPGAIDDAFEEISKGMNEKLACNLQYSTIPAETLGCFVDDYNLNPFESLCVFLREDSLDNISCGNFWIDYLISTVIKFIDQCDDGDKRVLQNYFELHIEEFDCIEDCLLDKFLRYCGEYENENIRKAYYKE